MNPKDSLMTDVLFAVGLGVKELRAKVVELDAALESAAEWGGRRDAEAIRLDQECVRLRTSLTHEERRHHALREEHEAGKKRGTETLAKYDALTLGLSVLIPELDTRAANAKTKAARNVLDDVRTKLLLLHRPAGHDGPEAA